MAGGFAVTFSPIGLTMCSGKRCATCGETKPLTEFHKAGKRGHHGYCKPCYNARPKKRIRPKHRTDQQLRARYGITLEQRDEMLAAQGGICPICRQAPKRPVVDHCHDTGAVRGVLCHGCNIKLHGIENKAFLAAALAYLEGK